MFNPWKLRREYQAAILESHEARGRYIKALEAHISVLEEYLDHTLQERDFYRSVSS